MENLEYMASKHVPGGNLRMEHFFALTKTAVRSYPNAGRTAMARPTKSPEHFYLLTFPEKHIGTFMVMVI